MFGRYISIFCFSFSSIYCYYTCSSNSRPILLIEATEFSDILNDDHGEEQRDIAYSCPCWLWCEGTAELTKVIRYDKDYIGFISEFWWNMRCVSASNPPLWLSSSVVISYTFNITEKQQNHNTCRYPQSEHIHITVLLMSWICYISVWGKLVDTLLNALLP